MLLRVNDREHATILAALRSYQRVEPAGLVPSAIEDIATNCGLHEPMLVDEIDALCERINTETAKVKVGIYLDGGLVQDVVCDADLDYYVLVDKDIMEGAEPSDMRQLWENVDDYNEIASPDERLDLEDFQRGFCLKCGDEEHDGKCDPLVDNPRCFSPIRSSCTNRATVHFKRKDGKMMTVLGPGCSASDITACASCSEAYWKRHRAEYVVEHIGIGVPA